MLSHAVESNMIYSDRAGFLDEMNRPHQRQQMAEVFFKPNKTTTIMSKSRAPKRKEQEHMPPDEVTDFCSEILEAGMRLISVSSTNFPNAELISNAIQDVRSGREVGHLPREQCRVCDDQRDSQCEYFCFFIPNQCNV